MIWWFFLIVGLLIFAPRILLLAGAGVIAIAIPLVVFFAVSTICFFAILAIWPDAYVPAIAIGFVAGVATARSLVKKTLRHIELR